MSEENQTQETPVADLEAEAQSEQQAKAAADVPGKTAEAPTEPDTQAEAAPSDAEVIAQLRVDLAAAEAKSADYLDRLQRTAAEFQNSRRRLENQVVEETERANAGLLLRILPVLDDFERAFEHGAGGNDGDDISPEQTAWLEGFRQIQKKLMDLLVEQGVTQIATNGEFDPMHHEAITSEPSESVPSGHIIATLRNGYEYRGRVLRPALVRVAM